MLPRTKLSTRVRRTPSPSVPHQSWSDHPRRMSSPQCSYARSRGETPLSIHGTHLRRPQSVSDTVNISNHFEGRSRCSAVAPDGTVWTGETDGSIVIRLAPSGEKLRRIDPFAGTAALVLVNANGRMWIGYSDGAIRIFDHATRAVLHAPRQRTAALCAMCAVDGFVYTGGADWKLHEWDATDVRYSRMYHGHRNTVRSLATYTDELSGCRYVLSGSDDETVKIWSVAATKMSGTQKSEDACVATLEGHIRGALCMLIFEDTAELWVGCGDTVIRVWSLSSMTVTAVVTAHRTPVVTLQRVEETVWSGSKDGCIAVTDRLTKDVFHQASQPPARSNSPARTHRVNVSILPVTCTRLYHVWATAEDGSWTCWDYTIPEDGTMSVKEGRGIPSRDSLSLSRQRRSSQFSESRCRSVRRDGGDAQRYTHLRSGNTLVHDSDEVLRESVAQTRHTVAALLASPAEPSFQKASCANLSEPSTHRHEDPQRRR